MVNDYISDPTSPPMPEELIRASEKHYGYLVPIPTCRHPNERFEKKATNGCLGYIGDDISYPVMWGDCDNP